ncbi:LLM class F420-dependent oxidoreductase [Nocardia cyriacigeorgica]|uniref:LLM class F420-dependent oxidoreductase n=1 Tax=Nocardia cyriacigeorgica TaxID=135487 RepID=A0A6P1DGF5_9NOCA|nr:LLM class F420-dependent oxidoreductase [Nocardia cyriacigeorgica]NEW39076.1 LLM class F420-dependent oxidoreductase [Nocardia cyriacigeorgica]NEW47462.1 LLM class F420-dependent oxidoreductase [Nocardia cyriacigeorgica]NEW52712.1 LLM class F420-dependent oxidoreductase [Nocardia cyriacigeorgica]NEW57359.1 LLM class F420-dependent oxidoreductase [Nocardia cyriacigeorgica]
MTIDGLGRFGVWRGYQGFTPEDARELEGLGYSTLWLGGSPPADLPVIEDLLAATEALHVGTSIVNIWTAPAAEVAASFHRIEARFPGRFLLGIGAGHPEFNGPYRKPYDALVEYLDELDEAGVPQERRALAALGPRVLKLAADRTAGALPYLVPPAHTASAREALGPALLAVEHKVVLDDDANRARTTARPAVQMYLGLGNYVRNLRRFGFSESDVTAPGTDDLIDALALHGSAAVVAERLRAHLEAGADHIAVQPLGADYMADLRTLAPALIHPA